MLSVVAWEVELEVKPSKMNEQQEVFDVDKEGGLRWMDWLTVEWLLYIDQVWIWDEYAGLHYARLRSLWTGRGVMDDW